MLCVIGPDVLVSFNQIKTLSGLDTFPGMLAGRAGSLIHD